MAHVKVNRNLRAVYALPENHHKWTDEAAHAGKAAIQSAAPRQTGFLKMSMRTRTYPGARGPTVRYEALPDYALYQEVGTGIYGPRGRYITPKRAKMLSWINTNGDRLFAKKVRGVKPQRYFRKGLNATFGRRNVRYYGAAKAGRREF